MTFEYLESRLGWGYNFFNKECLPWGCTKNTDYTGFEEEAADTDLGETYSSFIRLRIFNFEFSNGNADFLFDEKREAAACHSPCPNTYYCISISPFSCHTE